MMQFLSSYQDLWNPTPYHWVKGCQCLEGATVLQNVTKHSPDYTASHT
jgi:hypothetical protein